MATKRMYKKGGTTSKKMGGLGESVSKRKTISSKALKRKQMGGRSPQPAASFIEPPIARPFEQKPNEFVAKKGGAKKKQSGGERGSGLKSMRDLKKTQRQDRKQRRKALRADRKSDRQAVRTFRKQERLKRRDRISDAGEDITLSRADKRSDRKATRRATRTFKKQERKERRSIRKSHRTEDRSERKQLRTKRKEYTDKLTEDKLNRLNQGDSSSVKKVKKEDSKTIVKKEDSKEKKKETQTADPKNTKSIDNMSFSEAYRTQRDANKKAGIKHYGDDRGYFTWRGKEYNTESREEKALRTKNKEKKKVVVDNDKDKDKDKEKKKVNTNNDKKNVKFDNEGNVISNPKVDEKKSHSMQGDTRYYAQKGGEKISFKKAFADAKKAGKKEFTWQGKKYNTKLKSKGSTKEGEKSKQNYSPGYRLATWLTNREKKKISKKVRKAEEEGQDSLKHKRHKYSVKELKKRGYNKGGYRRRGGVR